jgi:hypothetical protein
VCVCVCVFLFRLMCENLGYTLTYEALCYDDIILRTHKNYLPNLKGHIEIIKS